MKWKDTRRLLTPAFHFKILDTFFDVFNRNSTVLTEVVAKKIEESNAGEMDMIPLMKRCTLDIICGELDLIPLTIVANFQLDVWCRSCNGSQRQRSTGNRIEIHPGGFRVFLSKRNNFNELRYHFTLIQLDFYLFSVIDAIMKRTFNAWRLFPDWVYTQLSPGGRQFQKDVSVLHEFTATVRSVKCPSKKSSELEHRCVFYSVGYSE